MNLECHGMVWLDDLTYGRTEVQFRYLFILLFQHAGVYNYVFSFLLYFMFSMIAAFHNDCICDLSLGLCH